MSIANRQSLIHFEGINQWFIVIHYLLWPVLYLGTKGELRWTGEWVSFLDTMLQLSVLGHPGRRLRLPTRVRSLRIDPSIHLEKTKEGRCNIKADPKMNMVVAGGVELRGKWWQELFQSRKRISSYEFSDNWSVNLLTKHNSLKHHPLNSVRRVGKSSP